MTRRTTRLALASCAFTADVGIGAQPNKRLKLAGGDRSKRSGVLCAGAHEVSFN